MFNKKAIVTAALVTLLPLATPAWSGPLLVSQMIPPSIFTPTPPKAITIPAPSSKPIPRPSEKAIETRILMDIAEGAEKDGKLMDAVHLYEQVIGISKKTGMSLDSATANGRLAALWCEMEKYGVAVKYATQSLDEFQRMQGPVGTDVGITLNNLGWIQEQLGHKAEAESRYNQALSVLQASGEYNDDMIGSVENNLADLLASRHRMAEAKKHYQLSYTALKNFFGPDYPLTKMVQRKMTKLAH